MNKSRHNSIVLDRLKESLRIRPSLCQTCMGTGLVQEDLYYEDNDNLVRFHKTYYNPCPKCVRSENK